MAANKTIIETDSKGIHHKLKHVGSPGSISVAIFYAVFNIVVGSVGLATAWFLAYARTETKRLNADAKISILVEHNLGWLFLGIFLLKLLQVPIYIFLGEARKASKVVVPNQHVYCIMGSEGSKFGYVLMETEGEHGAFNRAQRALMNYHETFPTLALQYVAASWVFPFEAFICGVTWAVTRCIGAVGYRSAAWGRFNGNILGLLAMYTIQGMVLIASIKALSSA